MSIDVLGPGDRSEHSFIARAASAALGHVKAINAEMQHRARIHRDRQLLMAMPDHMLKDIGIRRSDIDFALGHGREVDRIRDDGRL